MALQTAAHAAAPAAATVTGLGQQSQVVANSVLPGTSNAALASNTLASSQSASRPAAYASHMQSFPMAPPALSVMVPTNTASQSYHNSPSAPQVCCIVAQTTLSSWHAQHVTPKVHLQVDVLTMRLAQDLAFQQAVQRSHVQAAAKAAVGLLGVRPALQLLFHCTPQSATCACTEHVALQAFYNETPSTSPNYGHFAGREFKEGDRSART